tara:strand:- start:1944 stop:2513 length:570 start_codon:yes stop_codon:yes gene_type:complete
MVAQIVRSIVMPNGIVTAHADRKIIFKPVNGIERIAKLPRRVTVMMACKGTEGMVFRLLVGDAGGSVHILSLPELKFIQSTHLSHNSVTALALHEPIGKKMVVAGLENGEIHAIGDNLTNGSLELFKLENSIGLICSNEEILIIHSGWVREVRHWNGDPVKPARRWFEPPIPPNRRNSTQLTLPKAAPA